MKGIKVPLVHLAVSTIKTTRSAQPTGTVGKPQGTATPLCLLYSAADTLWELVFKHIRDGTKAKLALQVKRVPAAIQAPLKHSNSLSK